MQLLSKAIQAEGGIIEEYKGDKNNLNIDYLLINPKVQIQTFLRGIKAKIWYKAILDYHFAIDSSKSGILLSIEKYTLYSTKNIEICENTVTMKELCMPSKKVKV